MAAQAVDLGSGQESGLRRGPVRDFSPEGRRQAWEGRGRGAASTEPRVSGGRSPLPP